MTPCQREILQALEEGYWIYSFPATQDKWLVWKGNNTIDSHLVEALVDEGYVVSRIENGGKLYSLTDAGRTEVLRVRR